MWNGPLLAEIVRQVLSVQKTEIRKIISNLEFLIDHEGKHIFCQFQ